MDRNRRVAVLRKKLLIFGSVSAAFILMIILIVSAVHRSTLAKEAAAKAKAEQLQSKAQAAKAEAEPVTLTVSTVGDCTLGTDENFDYDTSLNAFYEAQGGAYFFKNIKSVLSADDLTIANLETTLTTAEERQDKEFAFKGSPEMTDILTQGSVEAVTLANNHSHDYGDQSYTDTQAAVREAGVIPFGYDETAVTEIKDVKVGLVGIYELKDHLDRTQQLKDNIREVKDQGAQLIIAVFHWGNERETMPDSNQVTLGHLAIDEGAHLVVGHHPHVLQGIENYKGRNIVYSLGNFCFGGNSYPSDMDTMVFQQTFTVTPEETAADNVTTVIPCSISSEEGFNNYQPTPASGEEKTRIMDKITERSEGL